MLNDQSLSAVNQLLSKRYKKPVAHSTVARPQRHDEAKAAEDEAVWEEDDTAATAEAQELQPIVAVGDGEQHDLDDDMWQTDDTQHLQPPHPPDPNYHALSHSDNDDDHQHLARSHRMTAEEAETYRQQQEAIAASSPNHTQPSHLLSHRTEVAVDDDNQSADADQGGAINIELPKDLVTAVKDAKKSKADKAAAAAAAKDKKKYPHLTAEAKSTKLKIQKLHLLTCVALLQRYSAVADNEELQGQLLSLLPARLMLDAGGVDEPMSPSSGASVSSVEVAGGTNMAMATFGVDWVKQITSWYHHLVFLAPPQPSSSAPSPLSPSSSPTASPGSFSSSSSAHPLSFSPLTSLCSLGHLPQFFSCLAKQLTSALSLRRTHSPHAKVLLFLTLLRSLHINARLVHAIEQTAYPWEQQGWMDELRRIAVSTRVKVDVGQLKEMRIGGRMRQVIDKRGNLERMWRVALPRMVVDVGSGCACGGSVEWRYAGLASTVVPPVRSVSLMGRKVSISRADSDVRDEVVIDDEDDEVEGKEEKKERVNVKAREGRAKLEVASRKDDEEEDKSLASKLVKKEKLSTAPTQQAAKVQQTSASRRPISTKPEAPLKAEADHEVNSGDKVKNKRRQRLVREEMDDEVAEEEEDDDAAIYAASLRRRKARAVKSVKEEKGQRRSERVKQQAEADVIVLSSDDEEAVTRIKQLAEERERDMLRRLQDEEEEQLEEEQEEDEGQADEDNMVRPKKERSEGKKEKKAVKRRLMTEENLVSSEDSDVESHSVSWQSNNAPGVAFTLKAESANGTRAPARLFTLEEEDEMDNIPLVSSSVDNTATSAVNVMMDEAKQADSHSESKHVPTSSENSSKLQPTTGTARHPGVGKVEHEEAKDGGNGGFRRTSCYVCGSHRPTSTNPILLCDSCDRECHLKCVTPSLNKVPKGNWYCQYCTETKDERNGEAVTKEEDGKEEKKEAAVEEDGEEDEEDEDEEGDEFVPRKKTKSKVGTDSKRKKRVKADVKKEKTSQRSHVFDRYQFSDQPQNGKEEKEEVDDEAVDNEDEPDATDGDNSSVMEDVTPRKQLQKVKKRSTKRASSSPSPTSSSRSRRSSSAASSPTTSSSPSASSSSKSKARTAGTDPTGLFLPFWIELYCPSKECWIHVDPINNLVDAPHTYESLKPRHTFSYVLAAYPPVSGAGFGFASGSGSAMALPYMSELSRVILDDVTARYEVGSALLARGRLDEQWWESTLQSLSAPRSSAYDRRIHEAEQSSFQASKSTSLAELPTTAAALKKHPLYISLDQVKKFEMLRPGAPIAARTTVAKQQVALYWRKDVHILHTAERWVREKRQVREDQVGKPSKVVKSQTMAGRKKRKIMQYARAMQGDFDRLSLDAAVQDIATSSSASTSASTIPDDDEQSALYGIWQTDPWTPPVVKDGLVPRNARGQVDLWTATHLPVGCVHLPYPRIAAIARKLGVDYAEAMVGFEVRGGRSIPKFDGIVVIERNAGWVLDAYREKEAELKEKEDKKRWERVSFNWRRLVKGAVVRAKVMADLKERNESLEGKDEEQKSSSKKGKGGKRGKKGHVNEDDHDDEQEKVDDKKGGKRKAVPRGSGDAEVVNDLNHVHDFTSNKTMNRETGSWIATCRCGARNEFEDL